MKQIDKDAQSLGFNDFEHMVSTLARWNWTAPVIARMFGVADSTVYKRYIVGKPSPVELRLQAFHIAKVTRDDINS